MTDLEGLRVAWAVKQFISFILRISFTIVTDHDALKALSTKEKQEGRMRWWTEFSSAFDYKILYLKGM